MFCPRIVPIYLDTSLPRNSSNYFFIITVGTSGNACEREHLTRTPVPGEQTDMHGSVQYVNAVRLVGLL